LFYACRTMNTANSSGVLIECVARFACWCLLNNLTLINSRHGTAVSRNMLQR
jgi:hypothetical protein